MSLIRDFRLKIDSINYKIQARSFLKTDYCINHEHNKKPPATNWERHHINILSVCNQYNVSVEEFKVDKLEFYSFKKKYKLPLFSLYALNCKEKKFLEHFISFKLLEFKEGERYIDIASENSPMPILAEKNGKIHAYSQDLTYPKGFHGKKIGSSADALPIKDNWVDKASLQCAFEHFEGNIDTNFMHELARTLKPGGRCVIVPLYTGDVHLNIYDPIIYNNWENKKADNGSTIISEIELGGHFERVYSPQSLSRIFIPNIGLNYTLYKISNKRDAITNKSAHSLEQVKRIRYALLIVKEDNQAFS